MTDSATDSELLADIYEERSNARFAQRVADELDWDDFERFVAYVFERAGYTVENTALQFGQGIDLKLYSTPDMRGKPVACVSVKHHQQSGNREGLPALRDFQTAVQGSGIPIGYIVTNTGFRQPAIEEVPNWPKLRLIDGELLRRYIVYVRGTRPPHPSAPIIAPDILRTAEAVPVRDSKQTKVVAVANNKGGVGKTTTALYLARRLAEQNARVLLVDFDSQLNLTFTLPPPAGENVAPLSLADYFSDEHKLHELVRPTELKRVYMIPSHESLRVSAAATAATPQAEMKFVAQLHATETRPPHFLETGDFDWIIIDTPPEMSFRTRAALAASHFVVAPTEPGAFETSGLQQLLDTVETMQGLVGRPIRILGCVFTKWKDDRAHEDSLQAFKQRILTPNGIHVFDTKIPLDGNIGKDEAAQFRLPILNKKPAAKRYSELVTEVINHANNS